MEVHRNRIRWDYNRGTWRMLRPLGRLFLRRCPECNHQYWGGMNKRRCQKCARTRYDAAAKAHGLVSRAIKKGLLRKPSEFACVDCGLIADRYDHRDYEKPLEVDPVCHGCNFKRGAAVIAQSRRAA